MARCAPGVPVCCGGSGEPCLPPQQPNRAPQLCACPKGNPPQGAQVAARGKPPTRATPTCHSRNKPHWRCCCGPCQSRQGQALAQFVAPNDIDSAPTTHGVRAHTLDSTRAPPQVAQANCTPATQPTQIWPCKCTKRAGPAPARQWHGALVPSPTKAPNGTGAWWAAWAWLHVAAPPLGGAGRGGGTPAPPTCRAPPAAPRQLCGYTAQPWAQLGAPTPVRPLAAPPLG